MPDKMMRIAGRGEDGLAKAVQSDDKGHLLVKKSGNDNVQINNGAAKTISNEEIVVIDEFETGDAEYVRYGMSIFYSALPVKFVIESIVEGGTFGRGQDTVFRIEETITNRPTEEIIFDSRGALMYDPGGRVIMYTHKIPLFGHKTRLTAIIDSDPSLVHASYFYAVSRRML